MALVEYYVGSVGPLYVDDTDPNFSAPTQMALKQDVANKVPSDTVSDETSFGITPAAGTSEDFSRGDHTHGSPTNPVSGLTQNIAVVTDIGPPQVKSTLHFTNGLLTSIT